ncbi:class I SAM-dependent methyltransferase [Parafrankia sp. BMG5.11]|nr:class I SAM-dependent methyltransferase [Parafrankia sp. BMG5.11]
MGLPRWTSVWHQLNEVAALKPNKVMEVGPGAGYFKAAASCLGIPVETVDLDPELRPDHVASVTDLPFLDCSFDLTCAFQVLEHLPFEVALTALSELTRVARQHVVISLPDASRTWRYLWHLPKLGERRVLLRRPQVRPLDHHFDGEHYWELNKRGYDLDTVIDSFLKSGSLRLDRTFRPFENAYHRFFVFSVRPTTEQIARS